MHKNVKPIAVLAAVGLAVSAVSTFTSAASADKPSCMVVDVNSNTSYGNLQAADNVATAGDTLFVKGTCTGTTTIDKNLTLTGQSNGGTKAAVLDGNQQGSVLTIAGGVSATLNKLAIIDGSGSLCALDVPGLPRLRGGGVCNLGDLTLNESAVTGNTAEQGGGIFSDLGSVTLNDSILDDNTASLVAGGIFDFGATSTLTMNGNSSISGNVATLGGGGGVLDTGAPGAGAVTMNDSSSIFGNRAGSVGGGVLVGSNGSLTMNGSSMIHNNAAIHGGGIFFGPSSTLIGVVAPPLATPCPTDTTGFNVYCNIPENIV